MYICYDLGHTCTLEKIQSCDWFHELYILARGKNEWKLILSAYFSLCSFDIPSPGREHTLSHIEFPLLFFILVTPAYSTCCVQNNILGDG